MFRPMSGPAFVEVQNTSGASVDLWDPQNPLNAWVIGPIRVPGGTTMPANSFLLIVEGDPGFARAFYNVPAHVPVLAGAPISSFLGEYSVAIQRPSGLTAEPAIPRWIEMEKMVFTDKYPWPSGAAAGASMERIDVTRWANDPANWRTSPTGHSAGRLNSGNLPPLVWAGEDRIEFIGSPVSLRSLISDDSGPGALSVEWNQVNGPGPVMFTSPTPVQTTASFPATGTYLLRLTASDGTSSTSDTVTISVMTRPMEQWRSSVFTPAEQGNAAISGALADPDRDGRLNVVEYLFNSAPKQPAFTPTGLLATEIVNGRLQIRWSERAFAPDVIATPQRADRIEGPWFSAPELFERMEVIVGGLRQITVRDKVPVTARPSGYMRLQFEVR
jgi:hypothetical protein